MLSYGVESVPPKCYCRILWCRSEADLWPFGYKMPSRHHFILFVWNFVRISAWTVELWPKNVFGEGAATLTFEPWPPKSNQCFLESKWMFMPNVKEFPQGVPEISPSRGWDVRTGGQTTRKHKTTGHSCISNTIYLSDHNIHHWTGWIFALTCIRL